MCRPSHRRWTHRKFGTGQDIDTSDNRFSGNVVLQDGSLWGVRTVDVDGTLAGLQWFEIDEATDTILQSGTISDDNLSLYFPSIAVNDFGDVVIGFSGSDANTPVSSYYIIGETTSGVTTFGDITLSQAGNGTYERLDGSDRNRWGDYSATVVDPSHEGTFWTFQEFVDGNHNWAVQITEITICKVGDVDCDGDIDFQDFIDLQIGFGITSNADRSDGDLDGDGDVDFQDFLILQQNFGLDSLDAEQLSDASIDGGTVPEPSTVALLALGLVGACWRQAWPRRSPA